MTLAPNAILRPALRGLKRSPGFAAAVLALFALGIGSNAAVVSALRAAVLRPLPIPDERAVVELWQSHPDGSRRPVAPANFLDWRRSARSFAAMSSHFVRAVVLRDGEHAERHETAVVSGNFFDLMGLPPVAGGLRPSAATRDGVVLGEALWRGRFGGDASVIGRVVAIDGEPVEVLGVAPARLALPPGAELWRFAPLDVAPLGVPGAPEPAGLRDVRYLGVYARLAPGVELDAARAELATLGRRLSAEYPEANQHGEIQIASLHDAVVGPARGSLALLAAGAALVLLLANLNLAQLLLLRAARRGREFAVRDALGAGRARLAGEALAEVAALALGGALLAIVVAGSAARALLAAVPGIELAGREAGGFAGWGFAGALLVSIGVAFAAGLVGVARAGRGGMARALGHGGLGARGGAAARARRWSVGAQAGFALALVSVAFLLGEGLLRMERSARGFETAGRFTARLSLVSAEGLDAAARRRLLADAVERLGAVPGIGALGGAQTLPLSGMGASSNLRIEGEPAAGDAAPDVAWRAVTPEYLPALGARLLAGRLFDAGDHSEARPVVLINRALARQLGLDPAAGAAANLGRRRIATGLDGTETWLSIVGVVDDMPQIRLGDPARPEMYRPLAQASRFGGERFRVVGRLAGNGGDATPGLAALREAARQVSPRLLVDEVRPLAELAADSVRRERVLGALFAAFAAMALLLATVGVYGLIALWVEERRREFGVRLAVGATMRELALRALGVALSPVGWGLAAGSAGLALAWPALAAALGPAAPADWRGPLLAAAALFAAALAAAAGPAWRAGRTDPIASLRPQGE